MKDSRIEGFWERFRRTRVGFEIENISGQFYGRTIVRTALIGAFDTAISAAAVALCWLILPGVGEQAINFLQCADLSDKTPCALSSAAVASAALLAAVLFLVSLLVTRSAQRKKFQRSSIHTAFVLIAVGVAVNVYGYFGILSTALLLAGLFFVSYYGYRASFLLKRKR